MSALPPNSGHRTVLLASPLWANCRKAYGAHKNISGPGAPHGTITEPLQTILGGRLMPERRPLIGGPLGRLDSVAHPIVEV